MIFERINCYEYQYDYFSTFQFRNGIWHLVFSFHGW